MIRGIGIAGLVFLIIGMAPLYSYWWWFDNPQVLSDVVYTIENTEPIKGGGYLVFSSHFCQSRWAIPNTAVRTIANSITYHLADTTISNIKPGCGANKFMAVELPKGLTRGTHSYQFCATYAINITRNETVCAQKLFFEVVE